MRCSISFGSMQRVTGSMSAKLTAAPSVSACVHGRPVRHRGADDLVARAHAARPHGRAQRIRAVGVRERVLAPLPRRELLLELLRDIVAAHRAGPKDLENRGLILAGDDRPFEQVTRVRGNGLRAAEKGQFALRGSHRVLLRTANIGRPNMTRVSGLLAYAGSARLQPLTFRCTAGPTAPPLLRCASARTARSP